jgi:Protein of unknown function (DUF4232)
LLTRSQWRLVSLLVLAVSSSAQPAPDIPPCREEQIEVSVTNAGVGMSHWAEGIEFLNTSADACSLRGVPRLILSGENGARLPAAICPNCDDYLFPARPATTVILKSGERAHVVIGSTTAFDPKFCGRANAIQIFLPGESHPLFAREHELYYCVKINVSAFLAGSARNDPRWNGPEKPPPLPTVWGSPSKGVQLSLTPFAHWQRLGVLGFHLDLRGFLAPPLHPRQCESATLRMWQSGKIVQSVTSSDRLVCAGPQPPGSHFLQNVLRMDVTTQEFGMSVNRAGMYGFDLVEVLAADNPITVTSNRVSIMVTNN